MGKRRTIDWEAIEREYRLGQKSIRTIADEFGVSHTAINKRAKSEGWVQDKTAEVQAKTKAALISFQKEVSRKVSTPTREDIDRAVQTNIEVIHNHRADIRKLREQEERLLRELGEEPTKLYITQYKGEIIEQVVNLTVSEQAAALRDLSTVQHKRIQLERQAFNLDASAGDDDAPDSISIGYGQKPTTEAG